MTVRYIIDKLYNTSFASREELVFLLNHLTKKDKEYLTAKAHEVTAKEDLHGTIHSHRHELRSMPRAR